MTGKERFARALDRLPPLPGQHVPHFELVFFLTMEEMGIIHPSQRHYGQWDQLSEAERQLHRESIVETYVGIAERYQHDAILVHPFTPPNDDETIRLLEMIRERSHDDYFIMLHGDATYSIPNGEQMMDFSVEMVEEPDRVLAEAARRADNALKWAERLSRHKGLVDGFALCSDYCFNTGCFFPPAQFEKFVIPFLRQIIAGYRELGFYTIKHTDGNIMPIIDELIACNPHALHSLDPQGGVDLAVLKRDYGDKVALIGNVNCGLLQTGTDEEVVTDVRRALRDGMPGGGYVFSTSNCVYSGMALERYRLMHRIWREEGAYPAGG